MSIDEPLFDDAPKAVSARPSETDLRARVASLLAQQPYGVLCVQGEGQPYGALVAFAVSDDLRHAVFSTPLATRKYRLLEACDRVALVVDNRSSKLDSLMEIEAITATGRARRITRGPDFDCWTGLLVARHPHLSSFVQARTCALFRIDVVRYLHVVRFQEVSQWIPSGPS